ncbi:MAG: type II toxin-antitoxin system VapC family toxin [candidate division NC10 bacterium]|nr:type II toxin-antitoxin system VapC family toxin [candidate division NC10 bacterium]
MDQVANGVVLDTDVVIDFLNGKEPSVGVVRTLIEVNKAFITAINAYELWAGAKAITLKRGLDDLFEDIGCLPLTLDAAKRAGEVTVRLRQQGMEIGVGDSLIAGICLSLDLPLITRNVEHFRRVKGLKVLSPQTLATKGS